MRPEDKPSAFRSRGPAQKTGEELAAAPPPVHRRAAAGLLQAVGLGVGTSTAAGEDDRVDCELAALSLTSQGSLRLRRKQLRASKCQSVAGLNVGSSLLAAIGALSKRRGRPTSRRSEHMGCSGARPRLLRLSVACPVCSRQSARFRPVTPSGLSTPFRGRWAQPSRLSSSSARHDCRRPVSCPAYLMHHAAVWIDRGAAKDTNEGHYGESIRAYGLASDSDFEPDTAKRRLRKSTGHMKRFADARTDTASDLDKTEDAGFGQTRAKKV